MHNEQFYINGAWVKPNSPARLDVINPATEATCATIALANQADVDAAFAAARAAFPAFSQTSKADRLELMREILAQYEARAQDMADAIRTEMGAPSAFAMEAQFWAGSAHIGATIEALEKMEFESRRGDTLIMHEAIGVAALITPWNWPMNQIACKVAPALSAGCTMVLKPSEIAPLSGLLFTEIMHKAGVPAGVYNMINGDGPVAGNAMSGHLEADIVSFTGSTRAGILVAKNAADTVKRVAQELGGKSANILLDDVDLEEAVTGGVDAVMANSGQSCDAPTRMLVPTHLHDRACDIAAAAAAATIVGDPEAETTVIGPVISQQQYDKVQGLIEAGLEDGARLVAGGPGRPAGLNQGYYVRPTVFGDVRPGMRIEREEIFGPVLSIMPYETEDDAVRMANDTVYGLAAYVQGKDMERVRRVARQLRAGQVQINSPEWDLFAPFGGYKQSGNGREYADWGIHDFLEVKALIGHG